MAGKSDGFCGHPKNAEALRKVLNKKPLDEALADLGVTVSICEYCMNGVARCECDEKRAALRQRLGDIAAGVSDDIDESPSDWLRMQSQTYYKAVRRVWSLPLDAFADMCAKHPVDLDSLAAWLWERGVRA